MTDSPIQLDLLRRLTESDPAAYSHYIAMCAAAAGVWEDDADEGRCCGKCDIEGGGCAYRLMIEPPKGLNAEAC